MSNGAVTGTPQAARENWLSQFFGGHWLRIENGFLLFLLLAPSLRNRPLSDPIWEPPLCLGWGPGQRRVSRCFG